MVTACVDILVISWSCFSGIQCQYSYASVRTRN